MLVGIVIFLILCLCNVLGICDGFELLCEMLVFVVCCIFDFEVIEGGLDLDIVDYVLEDSDVVKVFVSMKVVELSFGVSDFFGGVKGVYEMIFMGFENGDID